MTSEWGCPKQRCHSEGVSGTGGKRLMLGATACKAIAEPKSQDKNDKRLMKLALKQ